MKLLSYACPGVDIMEHLEILQKETLYPVFPDNFPSSMEIKGGKLYLHNSETCVFGRVTKVDRKGQDEAQIGVSPFGRDDEYDEVFIIWDGEDPGAHPYFADGLLKGHTVNVFLLPEDAEEQIISNLECLD